MTLADTLAAAVFAGVRPSTIRTWADRGLITRQGTDVSGRALYDLEEIEARIAGRRCAA